MLHQSRTNVSTYKTWDVGVLGMGKGVVGVEILSHLDNSMPALSEAFLMVSQSVLIYSLSRIHFLILTFLPFGFFAHSQFLGIFLTLSNADGLQFPPLFEYRFFYSSL